MDVKQLGYFLSIAEHGGFAAAARARYISQSALSRQVQLLESDIGTKLFERTSRGILLTSAGETLKDRAESLIEGMAQIKEDVRAGAEAPVGQLVLGMTPSMRVLLAGSLIESFIDRYPRVTLKVIEGLSYTMADAAARGICDVAVFVREDAIGKALRTRQLINEPFILVGPLCAGLRMDSPVGVEFVISQPLMISRSNRVNSGIEKEASKRGMTLNILMDIQSLHLVIDLVCRGVGYTMVPYSAASRELEAGYVSAAPIKGFQTGWVVAWPKDRKVSVAAHRMIDAVQVEFNRVKSSPLFEAVAAARKPLPSALT